MYFPSPSAAEYSRLPDDSKTEWNAFIKQSSDQTADRGDLKRARKYLTWAQQVLLVSNPVGDLMTAEGTAVQGSRAFTEVDALFGLFHAEDGVGAAKT